MTTEERLREALWVAIEALKIARDWHIEQLELDLPYSMHPIELSEDGMIPIGALIDKLEDVLA